MKPAWIWLAFVALLAGSIAIFIALAPYRDSILMVAMHHLGTLAVLVLVFSIILIVTAAGGWLAELWTGRRR